MIRDILREVNSFFKENKGIGFSIIGASILNGIVATFLHMVVFALCFCAAMLPILGIFIIVYLFVIDIYVTCSSIAGLNRYCLDLYSNKEQAKLSSLVKYYTNFTLSSGVCAGTLTPIFWGIIFKIILVAPVFICAMNNVEIPYWGIVMGIANVFIEIFVIYLSYCRMMVALLMVDQEGITKKEAVKESNRMMKGKKFKFIITELAIIFKPAFMGTLFSVGTITIIMLSMMPKSVAIVTTIILAVMWIGYIFAYIISYPRLYIAHIIFYNKCLRMDIGLTNRNNEAISQSKLSDVPENKKVGNAIPGTPTMSAAPSSPVQNAMPGMPTMSEAPSNPVQNAMPGMPTMSEAPSNPVQNAMPGMPTMSAAPSSPVQNAMPGMPTMSEAPSSPVQNAMPGMPAMSAAPSSPVQNAMPGTPTMSAAPSYTMSNETNKTDEDIALEELRKDPLFASFSDDELREQIRAAKNNNGQY